VIFCVDLTDEIRVRMDLREGIVTRQFSRYAA
jgi:hypothetical protein